MEERIRINKLLSGLGFCSRREADRLTDAGRVTAEGRILKTGEKVPANAEVFVDGKPVPHGETKILLLFYKPRGVVCSTKRQRDELTVTGYLNYPARVYPAGRLDKESEGLLLMTNEGELVNRILRARNYHEKEYQVTVDRPVTEDFLTGMARGVPVLGTVTRPCRVEKTGEKSFQIILTQGLNRQIRRMCEYFGYQVTSLKRTRILNLTLEGLKEGSFREITPKEREELERLLSGAERGTRHGGRKPDSASEKERHCDKSRRNKRTGPQTEPGFQGVLSGRPGNHG